MDGRLKQVSVGLVFVLSVSAVSGAVTYSQLRRGDDRPDKEEEKPKAAAAEKPARPFDVSGGAPVTDLKPESNPSGEFSIGQALGFGGGGGRDDDTMPGFTTISMYAKLWMASGIDYATLVDRLIVLAVERHAAKQELKTSSF